MIDLSSLMVEGINRFLTDETNRVSQARNNLWQRDFSSQEAFNKSIAFQRNFLSRRLGVVEVRVTPEMEVLTSGQLQQLKAETEGCVIRAVRWAVLEGLSAEGLLLQPKGKVVARIVMITQTPVAERVPSCLDPARFRS